MPDVSSLIYHLNTDRWFVRTTRMSYGEILEIWEEITTWGSPTTITSPKVTYLAIDEGERILLLKSIRDGQFIARDMAVYRFADPAMDTMFRLLAARETAYQRQIIEAEAHGVTLERVNTVDVNLPDSVRRYLGGNGSR